LNVFMESQVEFTDEEHGFCQALADVATIAILQNQAAKEARNVNGRLQRALDSRITVEQAMSILAERLHVDMAAAFALLRRYARDNNRQLSQVAAAAGLPACVLTRCCSHGSYPSGLLSELVIPS
jgi:hypothetical protein